MTTDRGSTGGDAPTDARVILDWSVIWRGAVTTAFVALPLSLLQNWLVDSERVGKGDPLNLLLYFGIMFAGAPGGYAAAKLAAYTPARHSTLQNGAAAAAVAAIGIQIAGAVRRMIVGEDVSNPLGWLLLALLLATFGMFGAWIHGRSHAPHDHDLTDRDHTAHDGGPR